MICNAIGEQANKLIDERSYSPVTFSFQFSAFSFSSPVTFSFPEYNRIPLCRRETLPLLAGGTYDAIYGCRRWQGAIMPPYMAVSICSRQLCRHNCLPPCAGDIYGGMDASCRQRQGFSLAWAYSEKSKKGERNNLDVPNSPFSTLNSLNLEF